MVVLRICFCSQFKWKFWSLPKSLTKNPKLRFNPIKPKKILNSKTKKLWPKTFSEKTRKKSLDPKVTSQFLKKFSGLLMNNFGVGYFDTGTKFRKLRGQIKFSHKLLTSVKTKKALVRFSKIFKKSPFEKKVSLIWLCFEFYIFYTEVAKCGWTALSL